MDLAATNMATVDGTGGHWATAHWLTRAGRPVPRALRPDGGLCCVAAGSSAEHNHHEQTDIRNNCLQKISGNQIIAHYEFGHVIRH